MMASQGIVSFSVDPNTRGPFIIDDAWVKDVDDLSPKEKLFIRTEVTARVRDTTIPAQDYRRAYAIWQQHGHEVIPSLHGGIARPYQNAANPAAFSPNAPLGYRRNGGGEPDMLSNAYIELYADVVVNFLRGLGDTCPSRIWLWNEPNLANNTLKPGENCPPGKEKKYSSLAPQVFMALVYTTAARVRQRVAAVKHIWPGPLSCLPAYGTDPAGSWEEQYLRDGLEYLRQQQVDFSTLPFGGLWLNIEGAVDDDYAVRCADALHRVIDDYKLTNLIGVGEWSIGTKQWDSAVMASTFKALDTHFDAMCAFEHPSYNSFGMVKWGVRKGGIFEVQQHLPAYDDLQKWLAAR